jgi:hypothetical protein
MFFYNKSDFIDIPRRLNVNYNTSTNSKADNNPGNISDLNNEFKFDEEVEDPDITNNPIIEKIKTTRSGRVIKMPKKILRQILKFIG